MVLRMIINLMLNITSSTVAGISGDENICSFWYDHFKSILTSCSDYSKKDNVLILLNGNIDNFDFSISMYNHSSDCL